MELRCKYIIIESGVGNRVAIVNNLDDAKGLKEEYGIKYIIIYSSIETLYKKVSRLRDRYRRATGKNVTGIIAEWIPELVAEGLFLEPDL